MSRILVMLPLGLMLLGPRAWADSAAPGLDANGQCVGDAVGDAAVAINELILAVNNALGSCPLRPVTLQFAARVGDADFACGTAYEGIGTSASPLVPSDFRFYVSDISLVSPSGQRTPLLLEQDGVWQHQGVALLDFENGSGPCGNGNQATNTAVRGTAAAGVYTGVEFTLGVPFALNHGDASTAPSPLNFTAMFWSWQSGYKFLRVDTADDKFRAHIGSTGCQSAGPSRPPSSCDAPNRATVTLTGFDPERSVIVADLKALLAGNDIDQNQPGTPPGCMSDPADSDCGPLFAAAGVAFPAGAPQAGQTFFRVEAAVPAVEHVEILVGSTADGGGALALHPEFDLDTPVPVPFAECLGGSGEDCSGGTRVHQVANPGINSAEDDDPDESFFALDPGVAVDLEVLAIDAGLSIRFDEQIIDEVGDRAVLGTTPEFHADPETQLTIGPDGGPSRYQVTFRISTPGGGFTASAPLTVTFEPVEAGEHD